MAGKFEAFVDPDSFFRFRLMAPDGTVIAVSGPFDSKSALAAGIAAVRECAGTGLVTDLCPAGAVAREAPASVPASALAAQDDCDDPRIPLALPRGPAGRSAGPTGSRQLPAEPCSKNFSEISFWRRNPWQASSDYPYVAPVWNLSPITFQTGSFTFH